MPELPEVETVRQGLNQLTLNHWLEGGEVLLDRTLAYPFSIAEFGQNLKGKKIVIWERRGKYLLAPLINEEGEGAGWLGVHLRMTGKFLWVKQETPLEKHTRVRFFFNNNQELRFVDPRTFGKVWWVPPDQKPETIITTLARLGPEPLSSDFTPVYLKQALNRSTRPLKTILLDQSAIAGLGNIYADEVLFASGLHPKTKGTEVTVKQSKLLHQAIVKILQGAIDNGGTTFRDFRDVLGGSGGYQSLTLVYGKKGLPCSVCQTTLERIIIAGRSTHFCPHCQS